MVIAVWTQKPHAGDESLKKKKIGWATVAASTDTIQEVGPYNNEWKVADMRYLSHFWQKKMFCRCFYSPTKFFSAKERKWQVVFTSLLDDIIIFHDSLMKVIILWHMEFYTWWFSSCTFNLTIYLFYIFFTLFCIYMCVYMYVIA